MDPRRNLGKSAAEILHISGICPVWAGLGVKAKFFLMLLKGVFLVLQGEILHARLETLPMLA
jgi:hypothetical protein